MDEYGLYTHTEGDKEKRDFCYSFFKEKGIARPLSLIQSMKLLYSTLKYMQIKFHKSQI